MVRRAPETRAVTQTYLIGLTGGIACGKSTVLRMLEALGARVVDADQVTHRVQEPGTPVYAQIVAAFGEEVLQYPGGPLDRRRLGSIVFADPGRLRELEAIVHPAVRAEIRAFLAEVAASAERPVAVIDAIKLIESGWARECDQVWVVTCPEEQQVARLVATRGMSEAEARQRIAAQAPQSSRLPYATVTIDNGGTPEATRAQVEAAWQRVLAALGSR
ncbi:MAG: dephospho-CoA kinase [Chloroflexi bacterium OHK40]